MSIKLLNCSHFDQKRSHFDNLRRNTKMWHTTFLDWLKVKYQSRKVDQKTPILDLYHRGTQKTVQFWTCIFTMSNSNVWTVICLINLSIWLRYETLTVKFDKFSVRAQWRPYQLYSAPEKPIALSSSEAMQYKNLKIGKVNSQIRMV